MSKYQLPAIADEDLDLAISAAVGAETRVFLSYDDIKNLADLEQVAAGTGAANADDDSLVSDNATLKLDRTYRAPETTTLGRDLVLICNSPIRSEEALEVVLNVVLNNVVAAIVSNSIATASVVTTAAPHGLSSGDTVTIAGVTTSSPTINGSGRVVTVLSPTTFSVPVNVTTAGTGGTATSTIRTGTATATIDPPATSQDQSFNFPQGIAVDFTCAPAGATVRTVKSVETITGGGPGNKLAIAALPDADSYTEVACATDKSFTPPTPQPVVIKCRYNPARWIKRGVGVEPKLDLKAKYSGFGDGLPRANGQRVTVKLETYKDDAILTERAVFGGVRAQVTLTHGEGNAESEATFAGMYENMALFC